jgi:hypothetical protein
MTKGHVFYQEPDSSHVPIFLFTCRFVRLDKTACRRGMRGWGGGGRGSNKILEAIIFHDSQIAMLD